MEGLIEVRRLMDDVQPAAHVLRMCCATCCACRREGHEEDMLAALKADLSRGRMEALIERGCDACVARMAEEHEDDMLAALKADLGRGRMEALIEVWHCVCRLNSLSPPSPRPTHHTPRQVGTPLTLRPGRSKVVYELLGVFRGASKGASEVATKVAKIIFLFPPPLLQVGTPLTLRPGHSQVVYGPGRWVCFEAPQQGASTASPILPPPLDQVGTPLTLRPGHSEVVHEPLGVVLIISPWNFPLLLSLEPLIGALAAGNVVVLKPSEHSPSCSHLLSRLLPLYLDSQAVQARAAGAIPGRCYPRQAALHSWDGCSCGGDGLHAWLHSPLFPASRPHHRPSPRLASQRPRTRHTHRQGVMLVEKPPSCSLTPACLPRFMPCEAQARHRQGTGKAQARHRQGTVKAPQKVTHSSSLVPRETSALPLPRNHQVVEGGPETAKALLGRRWDKIFFTGGTAVGRIVMEAASKHLTPVTLELGGKNPLFIDESADLEVRAADLEVCACCLECNVHVP
ncbi:unnamed protein product [Closterium sp. Yama58-4]|nr:unnamed protein product [Closterium sp. Yama58-4]